MSEIASSCYCSRPWNLTRSMVEHITSTNVVTAVLAAASVPTVMRASLPHKCAPDVGNWDMLGAPPFRSYIY